MRRNPVFASVVLLIVLAVPLRAYDGTITAAGYQPPPNITVFWRTFSGGDVSRRLNRDIPWSGSNSDATGYLGRYAEGKNDVLGRWIASQGVETQGGLSFLILRSLFRDAGITRDPDQREVLDFGIVHGGQRQLGCADFTRLIGRPDPTCQETPPSSGGLRPQPATPVGCCKKTLPCVVDDRRKPGETWSEAVLTPQGGRKGCNMIQPAVAPDPGTGDPGTGGPGTGDPGTGGTPSTAKCFFLKVDGAAASVTPVPCEQVPPPPG
jgi:hypothetical protein